MFALFKDFFTVSFKTYTDTIARFFDYIIKGLDEGFKNVPGSRIEPLRYPNEGFVKEYKKLLEMIKDLPPRSEVPVGTSRWYDFLRDLDSDTVKKLVPTDPAKDNNSIIANNIKFIKDNWQYLAGVTVFMIGSIVIICYWTDITNVFSSIKSGIQSFIGYFSGGGGGGGDDNNLLNPTADDASIDISSFTPRNRGGAIEITDSPNSLTQRVSESSNIHHTRTDTADIRRILENSPKVPTTPVGEAVTPKINVTPASSPNPWAVSGNVINSPGGTTSVNTPIVDNLATDLIDNTQNNIDTSLDVNSSLNVTTTPASPRASTSALGLEGMSKTAESVKNSPILSEANLNVEDFKPESSVSGHK